MKKGISILLVLAFVLGIAPPGVTEGPAFIERDASVVRKDREGDTLKLRFYEDQPSVPYFGFMAFSNYAGNNPMTYALQEDGTGVLTSAQGATAVADAAKGTMYIGQWSNFRNPPLPYEGTAVGLKDSTCGFVRVKEIVYEGEAKPVTLDFAKYGLHMYVEKDDVYLPLTLISTIMSDVATWNMSWNGEKIFYSRIGSNALPEGFLDSEAMKARLEGKREEDLAKEVYAELCFIFDNFFGHPGIAALDQAISEKGLEQALKDYEGTANTVEGLQSTDTKEYLSAMMKAFSYGLDDGHTSPMNPIFLINTSHPIVTEIMPDVLTALERSSGEKNYILQNIIDEQYRTPAWGNEPYHEYGSTAVIRMDSFMPDEAGWEKFYKGEGEIPADDAGNIISGLKKAAANPEIRNVIFDLSMNIGGYSDILAFMLGLTTGSNKMYGREKLTGQTFCVTYEADTNLDGLFDEKDKESIYSQFNYGVLTTRKAFSCGNLFPFLMQENGAVLLGEPSGGGSCCVQICSLSDGMDFQMSSSQWQLTDKDFVSVEGGCKTDLPIEGEIKTVPVSQDGSVTMEVRNYSRFFIDEELDRMMNEWFAAEEKPAA